MTLIWEMLVANHNRAEDTHMTSQLDMRRQECQHLQTNIVSDTSTVSILAWAVDHSNYNQRHSARTRTVSGPRQWLNYTNKHSSFLHQFQFMKWVCRKSKQQQALKMMFSNQLSIELLILIFYCSNFLCSWIMILLNYSGQLSVQSGLDQKYFIWKILTIQEREYLGWDLLVNISMVRL